MLNGAESGDARVNDAASDAETTSSNFAEVFCLFQLDAMATVLRSIDASATPWTAYAEVDPGLKRHQSFLCPITLLSMHELKQPRVIVNDHELVLGIFENAELMRAIYSTQYFCI